MLDQEDDPELYDEWLTADEQLTRFIKAREKIVGRVKGSESPSVQGTQCSEEVLVVRDRVPISTEAKSQRNCHLWELCAHLSRTERRFQL